MNPLATFSSIIESDQSPWRRNHLPEAKYRQMLAALPKQLLKHQIEYVPAFLPPLVPIQQYYTRLIENAFTEYLNEFLTLMEGAAIDLERTHYVTTALESEMDQQLRDIEDCFTKCHLPNVTDASELEKLRAPTGNNNDAFIINVMKFHLLAIVLNIQDIYPDFTTKLPKGYSDLHLYYFYEALPDGFFTAPSASLIAELPNAKAVTKPPAFEPVMDDIEGRVPKPVPFGEFIASSFLLRKMENYLFELEYLTNQYYLTDKVKKDVKREVCALILEMEQRRGFKEYIFINKKRKKITPAHILRFFNNRYQTDLTDVFYGMRRKEERYETFYDKRGVAIRTAFDG